MPLFTAATASASLLGEKDRLLPEAILNCLNYMKKGDVNDFMLPIVHMMTSYVGIYEYKYE
jgi:hypothetical protein